MYYKVQLLKPYKCTPLIFSLSWYWLWHLPQKFHLNNLALLCHSCAKIFMHTLSVKNTNFYHLDRWWGWINLGVFTVYINYIQENSLDIFLLKVYNVYVIQGFIFYRCYVLILKNYNSHNSVNNIYLSTLLNYNALYVKLKLYTNSYILPNTGGSIK